MQQQTTSSQNTLDLNPSCFLPSPDDFEILRERMIVCVERMLVDIFPLLRVKIKQHVEHEYSQEMSGKSEIVCLGTLDASPSSHEGVLKIMEWLQNYCPRNDQEIIPILCNGDGLSLDRMRDQNSGDHEHLQLFHVSNG